MEILIIVQFQYKAGKEKCKIHHYLVLISIITKIIIVFLQFLMVYEVIIKLNLGF
jgi:hypothetical protein